MSSLCTPVLLRTAAAIDKGPFVCVLSLESDSLALWNAQEVLLHGAALTKHARSCYLHHPHSTNLAESTAARSTVLALAKTEELK